MIIGRDMMVQKGLTADLKRQLLQWDGSTVHMQETIGLLGKFDVTKRKMHEGVMQAAEPASTQQATERMVKILDSIYVKVDLKQVADNATQINAEERNLLLSLIEDFEDLLDDTLRDLVTEPVNLELKPNFKPFNSRYYPVPIINTEFFRKELKRFSRNSSTKSSTLEPIRYPRIYHP